MREGVGVLHLVRDLLEVGDFSALNQPGTFHVRAGNGRSGSFRIAPDAYEDALRKTVYYFAKQRCGPSETGYHAPCHLDDGRRRDNGQHQDVTGGWHDACDLRKWVDATIFGMIGLARVAELHHPEWGRTSIPAELRWGNRYFLASPRCEADIIRLAKYAGVRFSVVSPDAFHVIQHGARALILPPNAKASEERP